FAQRRIAHNVQVGVSRKAKALSKRRAACLLDINQKFGGSVEPHTGVKRHHAGGGLFIVRAEAVRPAVVGVEIGMGLEDEVRLSREPESSALEMRKHRLRIG